MQILKIEEYKRIHNFHASYGTFLFFAKKIWDETPEHKKERLAWWTDARFGMFIHWGLYAQAARHEWVKQRERMTNEKYQKYFEIFNIIAKIELIYNLKIQEKIKRSIIDIKAEWRIT